jgi:hypothetical protein
MIGSGDFLGFRSNDSVAEVWEFIGGSSSRKIQISPPASYPTTVKLEAIGTTVKVYYDGVEVGSGTVAVTTAGRQGLRSTTFVNSHQPTYANYKVTDLT